MKKSIKEEFKSWFEAFKTDVKDLIKIPIPISISGILAIIILIEMNQFPYDNARYAYSAIFQGFAALLGIMITGVLITLQNIHTQKFNVEERIYNIMNSRFETHATGTIEEIGIQLKEERFKEAFLSHLKVNYSYSQSHTIMGITISFIQRNIEFLNEQEKHEKKLKLMFKISLGIGVIVLLFSLSALIIISPDSELIFGIDQINILIITVFLVTFSLIIIIYLMMELLKVWKLKI